jgi:hypothetical protein
MLIMAQGSNKPNAAKVVKYLIFKNFLKFKTLATDFTDEHRFTAEKICVHL